MLSKLPHAIAPLNPGCGRIIEDSSSGGSRKWKPKVNLRLDPQSLFRSAVLKLDNVPQRTSHLDACGPLTGIMAETAVLQESLQPNYGPLTAIMMHSSRNKDRYELRLPSSKNLSMLDATPLALLSLPSMLPVQSVNENFGTTEIEQEAATEQSLLDSDGTSSKAYTQSLPTDLPLTTVPTDSSAGRPVAASSTTVSQCKNDHPAPLKIYLNGELASRHIGEVNLSNINLTIIDLLMTSQKMTQDIVKHIGSQDFKLNSRLRGYKRKRQTKSFRTKRFPTLEDCIEPYNEHTLSTIGHKCRFLDCSFNKLGIKNTKMFIKHVESCHYAVKHTCHWCMQEYSRSDAALRHIKRMHNSEGRREIIRARESTVQQLIECNFAVASEKFHENLSAYHTQMILEECDEADTSEEGSTETSENDELESSDKTNDNALVKKQDMDSQKMTTRKLASPLKPTDYSDTARAFMKKEIECNSNLNIVLTIDPDKLHIRNLLNGSSEELVDNCEALLFEKGNKPKGTKSRDLL